MFHIKTKHTDCEQDKQFLAKLNGMAGTTDTYDIVLHSCVSFARMLFDEAPGSE